MKKLNIFCIIIGIICFLVAGYIVTDKILVTEDNKIEISEEKELKDINNHLSKIGSPLGWLIVKEGIDSQDDNGKYSPKYNYNYLEKYENRQLFVMEYILSYQDNIDSFTVLSAGDQSVVEDTPTSDFTLAYLDYKIFNKYYKELLGEDFKTTKGKMGNTKYDKDYVYFDNRHPGSNGVYVSMITSDKVEYKKGEYIASIKVTYSTRLADILDKETSDGIISYTKDGNNNIILKSFILKK